MKKVIRDKKVLTVMAVVVLMVALLASGIIATPQVSALGPPPPVESKISYQGQLTDSAGNPLNGSYDMEFQFWTDSTGGFQVGSAITKNDVQTTNGLFTVQLEVDQADFNGRGLWLEVHVEGEVLSPRQQILPTPYALSLRPGAIIQGSSAYGLSSITTDSYGLYGESSHTSFGAGVLGINSGGVGDGIQAESNGRAGIFAQGEGADSYGGYFTSEYSIGVYGTTNSADADTAAIKGENEGVGYGVLGQSGFGSGVRGEGYTGVSGESSSGIGVYGEGSPGVKGMSDTGSGVHGVSTASNGRGVYGEAPTYGVYGRATATSAFAPGVYGTSASTSGMGIYGQASADSGYTYGVFGRSDSTSGYGVSGYAPATSGTTYGVLGTSESPDGKGVCGRAPTYGVYGSASGTGSSCHGVYGVTSGDWGWASGVYGKATKDHAEGVTGWNTAGGVGVYGYSVDGVGVIAKSESGNIIEAWDADPSDRRFYVRNDGEVYADGSFHSGGADLAEMLVANEGLEPGDVLVISPDGKLARSSEPYATAVVGVYSANPGFVGGDSGDADMTGKIPLAVVGVVPVKASAENGSITPGDLLTSASMLGYAMKATDLKVGTIIGKALEPLDEDSGIINILVMLQ